MFFLQIYLNFIFICMFSYVFYTLFKLFFTYKHIYFYSIYLFTVFIFIYTYIYSICNFFINCILYAHLYTLFTYTVFCLFYLFYKHTTLFYLYYIHIHLYSLFTYILLFCSFHMHTIYIVCILCISYLFSYSCSHKHIKTHHDFNIFILVIQCQDCCDTWFYDSKADKRVGFLSKLAVSTCFAVLEEAQGRLFLLKPQMLLHQFFSHYCLMFLYFRL